MSADERNINGRAGGGEERMSLRSDEGAAKDRSQGTPDLLQNLSHFICGKLERTNL